MGDSLDQIRAKKPLIHHITNYVTVNDCANMTLAVGASPVMADDIDEVREMVAFAGALVLNIGTLNARTLASMLAAGQTAKKRGIPVVFDPVGAGATQLRLTAAKQIIDCVRPTVIRGNLSEIKILAGLAAEIKGVDSVADETDSLAVAQKMANALDCVVAITGREDVVVQNERICRIQNGHARLAQVTGTGCMATSLIGSFCAAADDPFCAAVAGITVMGLAGEIAVASLREGEGIGTFRMRLFDAVEAMTPEIIRKKGKIIYETEEY